jgi:hypothetical protein
MPHKPIYTFLGCRTVVDGQEVLLIHTPFSQTSESERALIVELLERLKEIQPVILVYIRCNESALGVVMPPEWEAIIESKNLSKSLLVKLPIYESDLAPKSSVLPAPHKPAAGSSPNLFSRFKSWVGGGSNQVW